jgi:hypothetical protein
MKKTWTTLLTCVMALSIPGMLGLCAWQSVRYSLLLRETVRLESEQKDVIERNNILIGEIATLHRTELTESIAKSLGLVKARPEDIVTLNITGGD